MKLNGWQRLWVLVSLLLFVPTVLSLRVSFPTEETIYHNWASAGLIEFQHWYGDETGGYATYAEIQKGKSDVDFINERMKSIPSPSDKDTEVRLKFKEAVVRINSEYEEQLHKLPETQRNTVIVHVLWWLAICVTLYVFGWLIAWVRRGFHKQAT
ncbi:hypothetical protein LNN38_14635 [Pseudomonas sp. LA21]|uniref:hypothetical protein n=1 Tax=Pseudomonas sp. LA21 TaxID=2893373 RepID=UPI001FB63BEA|nr:hypothetical protein [Pseudomonas sp. LA21]MCJ1886088.1 hypothetical protein [Pseudomonas sp. LA21]